MTQTALEKVEQRSAGQAMAVVDRGHVPAKPQQMTLREIQQWGDVFHQSGMFQDVKSAAAAMVKIKAGEELGFGPFASMAGIDIIKGKVSVGSGLQASLIKDSPRYRYSVKVLDAEGCTLEFFEREGRQWLSLGESRFSQQDAINAQLAGGDNYKKYARNMFFSRALTNGMRWYCPDLLRACGGQSETHDDFDVDETIAETTVTESGETVDTSTGEVLEEREDVVETAIDPAESKLADLFEAALARYNECKDDERTRANKWLGSKTIRQLDAEGLTAFLAEFPG